MTKEDDIDDIAVKIRHSLRSPKSRKETRKKKKLKEFDTFGTHSYSKH